MVKGVGTDILRLERIRGTVEDRGDAFVRMVFTEKEREQAMVRPDPVLYFATRFAGKEAVFKCFGINGDAVKLNEIEILGTEEEPPTVTLLGELSKIAAEKGIREIRISLSYDTDYAVAFAIAQD